MPHEPLTVDAAKEKLREYIERFRTNIAVYKNPDYNEARTRTEFIDIFFELLGWDVRNVGGTFERYRDVLREDYVIIDKQHKHPDYSFRFDGERKFFVEAKKPSVNIHDDSSQSFQLRRYGYTAKLALSILTDFEEFAVYNTKIKPNKNDKASKGRIFYCTFDKFFDKCDFPGYETNFDYIFGVFAKESVRIGNFDRYIGSAKIMRGTRPVDEELLESVEQWRVILAKSIAKQNPKLDIHALNFAVQRIVDRILFLRIAEDRRIEPYENLLNAAKGSGIYKRLQKIFTAADEKFNAGLFRQDALFAKLVVDDKILQTIIASLYDDCPYAFSVLPIEILGSVYERFLGKTILLTTGHNAKVEEKPEVRKAGGVYYTPQYIVDYIVQNTIGCRIAPSKPIPTISILDPACGSGSFLIGAYSYLLDAHLSYYTHDKATLKKSLNRGVIREVGDTYRLTIEEKQRILLNNIYGVDIDPIAVEVAKMSLCLKLLEGEREEWKDMLFTPSDPKLLADLDKNIRCGNSLIENDFYDKNSSLFDNDEMIRKVNAFDWHKEFPAIFKVGGFDIVIGNPPYVRIQRLNQSSPESVEYFKVKYNKCVAKSYDIYVIFIYRGLQLLNATGAQGMILPNKFFQAEMGEKIRKYVASQNFVSEVVDFSTNQVFSNATTYTCLLFLDKKGSKVWKYKHFPLGENITLLREIEDGAFETKKSNALVAEKWTFVSDTVGNVLNRISEQPDCFADITEKLFKGSSTGNDKIFLLDILNRGKKSSVFYSSAIEEKITLENDLLVPFLYGEDVRRYSVLKTTKYLLFPYQMGDGGMELIQSKEMAQKYPQVFGYLSQCKKLLLKRKVGLTSQNFYRYSAARSLNDYGNPKIMIPDMLVSLRVAYDAEGHFYHGPAIHSVSFKPLPKGVNEKFYLGILNSKVFWFFVSNTSTALRGDAYRLTPEYISPFCLPSPLSKNGTVSRQHDLLVELVDKMLMAQSNFQKSASEFDRKRISILDAQIDKAVYALYGLTNDEIRIVEGK